MWNPVREVIAMSEETSDEEIASLINKKGKRSGELVQKRSDVDREDTYFAFMDYVERLAEDSRVHAIGVQLPEFNLTIYSKTGDIASDVPKRINMCVLGNMYNMTTRISDGLPNCDELIVYLEEEYTLTGHSVSISDGSTRLGLAYQYRVLFSPTRRAEGSIELEALIKRIIEGCDPSVVILNDWGICECSLAYVKVYPNVNLDLVPAYSSVTASGLLRDLKLQATQDGFDMSRRGDFPVYIDQIDTEVKPYFGENPDKRRNKMREIIFEDSPNEGDEV